MGHLTAIANHIVLNAEKGVNKDLIEQRFKGKLTGCNPHFRFENLT